MLIAIVVHFCFASFIEKLFTYFRLDFIITFYQSKIVNLDKTGRLNQTCLVFRKYDFLGKKVEKI